MGFPRVLRPSDALAAAQLALFALTLLAAPQHVVGLRSPAAQATQVGLHPRGERPNGTAGPAAALERRLGAGAAGKRRASARRRPFKWRDLVGKRAKEHSQEDDPCGWVEKLAASRGRDPEQHCPGEASGPAPESGGGGGRRLALLLRGESFRKGEGQGNREDALTPASWALQMEAAESHLTMFVEPAEACGYAVDVFFATYDHHVGLDGRNATALLAQQYAPRVKGTLIVDEEHKQQEPGKFAKSTYNQRRMFNDGLRLLMDYHRRRNISYDAVLILRHDVVLLQPLLELPRAQWQRVLFPFKERRESADQEYASDVLEWYPWRFANCISAWGFHGHLSYVKLQPVVGAENIGYMMPGVTHNSNTIYEPNPLYRQVRRTPGKTAVILLGMGGTNSSQAASEDVAAAFRDNIMATANASFRDHGWWQFRGAELLVYSSEADGEHWLVPSFGHPVASASGTADGTPGPSLPCQGASGESAEAKQFAAWAYAAVQAVALLRRRELEAHSTYEWVVICRSDVPVRTSVDLVKTLWDEDTVYTGPWRANSTVGPGLLAMSRDLAVRFAEELRSELSREPCGMDPKNAIRSIAEDALQAKLEEPKSFAAAAGLRALPTRRAGLSALLSRLARAAGFYKGSRGE